MSATPASTALRVGVETLRLNPLRTILSTLGVVIGVASLVAVLAVGDGMEKYGLQSIVDEGVQSVVVAPIGGDRVDGVYIARTPTIRLTAADAMDLAAALPRGSDVTAQPSRPMEATKLMPVRMVGMGRVKPSVNFRPSLSRKTLSDASKIGWS